MFDFMSRRAAEAPDEVVSPYDGRDGMARREADLEHIDRFVASTRVAIFVREADNLLMIRPDKTLSLNATAVAILGGLYDRSQRSAEDVLSELAPKLGTLSDRLIADARQLVEAVGAMLNEDFSDNPFLRFGRFDRSIVRYPTLAEIALTYGCQNRCSFCYAASPDREDDQRAMTTDQVKKVMTRIFDEAHVPSLSFTGGEATLRRDLPELVRFGQDLGFRVNLISNGIRLAEHEYAEILVAAGLDSAQISLEAADAEVHDRIVGRSGAFAKTVAGVRELRRLGIHVHTNSTVCPGNRDHLHELIRFVGCDLGLPTMSMNMVIRTGLARGDSEMEISYAEVADLIPALLETAQENGVRLVWYSPIPYCIFNPVLHGLGAKSCACVDGILSVDPSGQVLPCSSFEGGIGSLLEQPFEKIYRSRAAEYWKKKKFVPPVCRDCADVDVCAGACPLYWDAAGSFDEIPRCGAGDGRARVKWEKARRRGASFGVPAVRRG